MGLYANYTNKKLRMSKKPVTINSVTYDPKTHKEDIPGFKWFKNKMRMLKYYGLYNGNDMEKELHLATLSNDKKVYVVARDEMEARDKAKDYINTRFLGDTSVYITNIEHLAETETKGFVKKLIL